jgi:tetratricopeptide (TPR) repeat protein
MRHRFWLGLCLALSSAVALHADARSEFLAAAEHQKAQRWAEAAQGYARVTALSPTYALAWKQLASCRYYLGDLEGAEASAQRYLTLNPNDAAFLAWDGQLRSKLKLAPLDLSTPVPTPIPTALPVDGAITAAPAPSTDAEVIDSSASTDNPDVGTAEEDIDFASEDTFDDFKFGISLRYLGEALERIVTPNAILRFNDQLDPLLMYGTGSDGTGSDATHGDAFVISPMRL